MSRLLRGLFVAVPVFWVAAAHVGPLLAMIRISVLAVYPAAPEVSPSFDGGAFASFLSGPGYLAAFGNTLLLSAAATAISFGLAWPLAWHLAMRVPPKRLAWRVALLVAPFWTSEVLRMFALVLLLSNRGAANATLRWLGVTDGPVPLLYGTGSVLTGIVYTVFLTMLLPLLATLGGMRRDLLDAAYDLGGRAWQRQLFVALPLASGGIASGLALTFLLCLGLVAAPVLLGGARMTVFATVIAGFFSGASGRWPMGAAFSLILLVGGMSSAGGLAWSAHKVLGNRS